MNPLSFLQVLFLRWKAKSPRNARIATNVMVALSVIVGLPAFLESQGVHVPQVMESYVSWIVSAATALLALLLKLTVEPNQINNQKP